MSEHIRKTQDDNRESISFDNRHFDLEEIVFEPEGARFEIEEEDVIEIIMEKFPPFQDEIFRYKIDHEQGEIIIYSCGQHRIFINGKEIPIYS